MSNSDPVINPCEKCIHTLVCNRKDSMFKFIEKMNETVKDYSNQFSILNDGMIKLSICCSFWSVNFQSISCGVNTQMFNTLNRGMDAKCCKENMWGGE